MPDRPAPRPIPPVTPRHPILARIMIVAVVLYLGAIAVGALWTLGAATHVGDVFRTSVSAPDESSPSWDCRTMGNRLCGVGAVGGPLMGPGPAGMVVCPDARADVLDLETGPDSFACDYAPDVLTGA